MRKLKNSELADDNDKLANRFVNLGKFEMPDNPKGTTPILALACPCSTVHSVTDTDTPSHDRIAAVRGEDERPRGPQL
jgi:hypothetical protein